MSTPLSSSARRSMRKDLIRLRMEMHRQQLLYHSRPLTHPLEQIGRFLPSQGGMLSSSKTPLAIGGALFLLLFGKRLGAFGKLARIGLAVYPIVRQLKRPRLPDRH
ncbi:hypothetical protein BZL41_10585 [Pseudomonas sp. PIC25]|uniref:hypothetical protein n=1 Tax=Pseudomonas sp. PIC25 TaxID=1958773 RepID=UPI000BABEEBD|nr:hypothetical protein [Pseudomonas sp. PIC25]PAU64056.1 hypothetical protein BZL41_10585 [Pseudomonas sp. PIC25]